jgi:HEPN domain-containing protein
MNSTNNPIDWVATAEEDYLLSRSSIQRKTPLIYGATFHAQQCAEKYIKALLAIRQIAFPRTHDLAALNTLCQQEGIFLPVSEVSLEKLSAFAVEVRDPGSQPTVDEVKEALQIATNIRRLSRKFLGI